MDPNIRYKESSFWSDLFALKAYRHVPNFITMPGLDEYPVEVDDGALFDFITNFSLMPAGKPRVVALGPFTDASVDALKRRFNESKYSRYLGLYTVCSHASRACLVRRSTCTCRRTVSGFQILQRSAGQRARSSGASTTRTTLRTWPSAAKRKTLAEKLLSDAYGVQP